MPSVPSYYDSIGLLVICDSIDAINGIPFHPSAAKHPWSVTTKAQTNPLSSSSTDSDSSANAAPAPPPSEPIEPLEHTLLSHIPVTGVLSPIGSIPYVEQQRVVYAQLANTGQLPPNPIAHTVGGVRPNVPVAHNLNGNANSRKPSEPLVAVPPNQPPSSLGASKPGSETNTPQIARESMHIPSDAQPVDSSDTSPSEPPVDLMRSAVNIPANNVSANANPPANHTGNSHLNLSAQTPPPLNFPPVVHGLPPADANMGSNSPALPANLPANLPPTMPIVPSQMTSMPASIPSAAPVSNIPLNAPMAMSPLAMPLSNAGSPNPSLDPSRAATPQSPAENSPIYRIEVCQICGRDFKGRKAATHKQQHIRRLHPTEYTPKRGGKKTRIE